MRLNGVDTWRQRVLRIQTRAAHKFSDFGRSLDWHARGGRQFFERYYNEIIAGHKWCFIVGCNNSGTTLLQDLLGKTLPVSIQPHEGQRYTSALRKAHKRGYERVWTEFIDDLQMSYDDSTACIPRLLHDWLREYETPMEHILIEKTTANAVRMPWLQKAFPNSYFIGLVRNGYAVTEGVRRKGQKSINRGARHWNAANKIMLDDAVHIHRFMKLSYEDMTAQPYDSLQKITEFLDLKINCLATRDVAAPLLDGVRNMNAESIARLNTNDMNTVQLEANEMLSHLGYEPSIADSNQYSA